jgi:tRNA-Thr(GGU) m(6)t(6)A37 methyltransferase TsaA
VSRIVFEPEYRVKEAFRGLEEYSHIWILWQFSKSMREEWSPTVRPPRLGGNTRMGVFATRSPFRPNNLGLSSVEIEKIDYECKDAPVIYVNGADILDGTPLFDIKPYLPFTDSHPEAKSGFSGEVMNNNLSVAFENGSDENVSAEDIDALREILSEDPRPHYHDDPERVYAFEFSHYKIKFRVDGTTLKVIEISDF